MCAKLAKDFLGGHAAMRYRHAAMRYNETAGLNVFHPGVGIMFSSGDIKRTADPHLSIQEVLAVVTPQLAAPNTRVLSSAARAATPGHEPESNGFHDPIMQKQLLSNRRGAIDSNGARGLKEPI
jgi:hypothetical protein